MIRTKHAYPRLAALLVTYTACGPLVFEVSTPQQDGGAVQDGESPDADGAASADAANDAGLAEDADGSPGISDASEITVHAWRDELPAPGVLVVFQNSAGRVLSTTTTNERGVASTANIDTAMITIAEREEDGDRDVLLQTVGGVRPADEIHLSVDARVKTATRAVDVLLPGAVAAAQRYVVRVSCAVQQELESFEASVRFRILAPCGEAPSSRIAGLAFAYDDVNALDSYSVMVDSLSETSTTVLTLPTWSQIFDEFDLVATRAPPQSLFLIAGFNLLSDGLDQDFVQPISVAPGATTSLPLRIPALGSARRLTVGVQFANGSLSGLSEPIPSIVISNREIDLETQLLPQLSISEIDWADTARPSVTWSATRSSSVDALMVLLLGDSNASYSWSLLLPATGTSTVPASIKIPELPSELADGRPRMELPNRLVLYALELDSVDGFEEAKVRSRLLGQSPLKIAPDERVRLAIGTAR